MIYNFFPVFRTKVFCLAGKVKTKLLMFIFLLFDPTFKLLVSAVHTFIFQNK